MSNFDPDTHPKLQFLFFIEGDIDDELRADVETLVQKIADSRDWVIGAPEFVDQVDGPDENDRPGDLPGETLGGVMALYTSLPPYDLPREVDIAHLEEVEALVEEIRKFSAEKKVVFVFELEQDYVGDIDQGEVDDMLSEALLGEWRRHLLG